MQSTLETIRNSLTYQSQFIVNHLNNTVLELPQLKDKTTEQGLTPQEKQRRWKEFKRAIFCSLFNQLHAVRIANVVSLVTMTQTGRRYFRNEILLSKNEGAVDPIFEKDAVPDLSISDHLK